MKKKTIHTLLIAAIILVFPLMMLSGCGKEDKSNDAAGSAATTEATEATEATKATEAAEEPEAKADTGKKDGERFESTIMIEGMEETVKYEHIINEKLGFEMDYDYKLFKRKSKAKRERFVSIYDDPENPENYLDVKCSEDDVDTAVAAISKKLSKDYEIIVESYDLDNAGTCQSIDASEIKGHKGTPDLMQRVFIIPADDGCRIATAHYGFESAEGFGKRFSSMVKTLVVIDRQAE